jgi:hydrogenase maturation protease
MLTEDQIRDCLKGILVPSVTRSLEGLNMIRNISLDDGSISVSLASAGLTAEVQNWIENRVKKEIGKLNNAREINIQFTQEKTSDLNEIKHVIAVMSGKGGVGKSLVSGLLAIALRRQGFEVGILDADITGPSIPKMFGINTKPAGSDTAILPVLSRSGIELMSINLLLPSEDEAVIWRGPVIGKAITQFWEEVLWGKLDYLFVDLPPGTADAPLTVMQTLPVSGVVIVFTPQDLTQMIVRKAVRMAQQMNKPVLGVVENMSYLYVSEIDKKIELFGRSKGEKMAKSADAPLLAQLPIDPELAKLCDEGNIEQYSIEIVTKMGESLAQKVAASEK